MKGLTGRFKGKKGTLYHKYTGPCTVPICGLYRVTVDGRNPAPVDMVNIPLFTGFCTSQVVSQISSINSLGEDFGSNY